MKNKKLFLIIYVLFVVVLAVSIIVLSFLGKKERVGYLSDFKLNIDKTLEINGLDINEIKQLFTIDEKLDEVSITNYIITNTTITNYNYYFRIKYYDKVFRNSDIYGVYLDTNKSIENNNFIKDINIIGGSPFGNLIVDKKLDIDESINVIYIVKIKILLLIIVIGLIIFLFIKPAYFFIIKHNFIISISIIVTLFILIIIFSILGLKTRKSYISNFEFVNYNIVDETTTNYLYNFEVISYNNSIFKNNFIYGIYPNIDEITNNNDFIIKFNMINYPGTSFGYLLSNKKIEPSYKIENVDYILKIRSKILVLFICILISIISIKYRRKIIYYINNFNLYDRLNNQILVKNDISFFKLSFIFYFVLFILQCWLSNPGDYSWGDSIISMRGDYTNANPIIITLFLHILYSIFGYNAGYILFLNLSLWYLGLYLITIALYIRFKNKNVLLISLINFLHNTFFLNINHYKDVTSSLWIWFGYSIIFFLITYGSNNKKIVFLKIVSILSIIIAMLWRHNIIVTIYPIFIFITYNILKYKNLNIKKYILSFFSIMILFFVILVFIYKAFPTLFVVEDPKSFNVKYTINHLFALQIAACASMSNDDSMIPDNWYMKNKNFTDLKNIYKTNPVNADVYSIWWYKDRIFREDIDSSDIKKVWIKYILKYPIKYIIHILNYSKNILNLKPVKRDLEALEKMLEYNSINYSIDKMFPSVKFSDIKKNIYKVLNTSLLNVNIKFFILLTFILLILTSILLILNIKYISNILLFSFTTSLSSFFTILIVIFFTPVPDYRYIHPIVPISILSLISFITFICDEGGIKNIFKNIIKNKK